MNATTHDRDARDPDAPPSALLLIAEGTEEIEAVTPADVLSRCGVKVTIAASGDTEVLGRCGLPMRAHVTTASAHARAALFDAVVVPGGAVGAENLAADRFVADTLRRHADAGKLIAAICAAPAVVLAPLGLLDGYRAACYPGMETRFGGLINHDDDPVSIDRDRITSRGPGTAMAFSLAVGAALAGGEIARRVADEMLVVA